MLRLVYARAGRNVAADFKSSGRRLGQCRISQAIRLRDGFD